MMKKGAAVPHYEFLREFPKQKSAPVYWILGNEEYLKDKVQKAIVSRFKTEGCEDFDISVFYGDEKDIVYQAAEQLEMMPFMAKYKIVILKKFDKMESKHKSLLINLCESPLPTSILILSSEKQDKRLSGDKAISKIAENISCKHPYNSDAISRWLSSELRSRNITMNTEARDLFSNSVETDYLLASNELEKLILYTKGSRTLTVDNVRESIGKSRTSSIFDMQNALGKRDIKTALQIVENMMENNESGIMIISVLTRFFSQMWKIDSLRRKNISDNEIVSRHLPEVYFNYRKDQVMYSKNFSSEVLQNIFSELLEADFELKSVDPKLEHLIITKTIYNIVK